MITTPSDCSTKQLRTLFFFYEPESPESPMTVKCTLSTLHNTALRATDSAFYQKCPEIVRERGSTVEQWLGIRWGIYYNTETHPCTTNRHAARHQTAAWRIWRRQDYSKTNMKYQRWVASPGDSSFLPLVAVDGGTGRPITLEMKETKKNTPRRSFWGRIHKYGIAQLLLFLLLVDDKVWIMTFAWNSPEWNIWIIWNA